MDNQIDLNHFLREAASKQCLTLRQIAEAVREVIDSPKWKRAEMAEAGKQAEEIIASWPDWKKAAVEDALRTSPTRRTPRKPVINLHDPY